MSTETGEKNLPAMSVEFHRSYRKLHYGSFTSRLILHLALLLIVEFLVIHYLEHLSLIYAGLASALDKNSILNLRLETIRFLNINIWILKGEGTFPSHALLFIIAMASLLGWVIAFLFKKMPLPLKLIIKSVSTLNLFACLYFWLWGSHFPYNLTDYSVLYVSSETGMWIATPVMLIFALMPIPVSILYKAGLVIFTEIYIFILGIMRYALFLFILAKFSYLWMAFLYFIFGVVLDFGFMIAFYSYFVSMVAPGIFQKRGIWRWLYSS